MTRYSIIICTYNRVSYLKETIDSLINTTQGRSDIEILIIDNNSTDQTPEMITSYENISTMKYFLENKQGLSHARNRGINEAKGDVLVFFDDDIDIEKSYFDVLAKFYQNLDVSIVGGKVLPYQVSIPNWLPQKYYYLVSVFDLGDKNLTVDKLMGANFSLRKNVALDIGWYNPDLGRKGNTLAGGEEIDYLNRAQKLGYKILYSPDLIIYHKINNKLNMDYILEYSFLVGKSEVFIDLKKSLAKVLIKFIKSFFDIFIYITVGVLIFNKKLKVHLKIKYMYALGYLKKIGVPMVPKRRIR